MNRTVYICALMMILLAFVGHTPAASDAAKRPTMAAGDENFAGEGVWLVSFRYHHETRDQVVHGCGDSATDPTDEAVKLNAFLMTLRYGIGRGFNFVIGIPVGSIESSLLQGAEYTRKNRGWGDMVVAGEYGVGTSSQLTLLAGLKLATANVDKSDEFGQRISDNLALGTGTTEFVLGGSVWAPGFLLRFLDVNTQARFRSGLNQNKWGYRFGDRTTFSIHGSRAVSVGGRVGLRLDGHHTERDKMHGHEVPDRGGTVVYLGPTLSANVSESAALGAYASVPIAMHLEGVQLVPRVTAGIEFSVALNPRRGEDR
jgi:hypothetical protein